MNKNKNPRPKVNQFKSSGSVRISDIRSKKARNLLRGIPPSSYKKAERALQKIKLISNTLDFKKSLLYLRTDSSYEDNGIGQFFNHSCPIGLSEVTTFLPAEIMEQVNIYDEQLVKLLDCAIGINASLQKNDLSAALSGCEELAKLKGVSIFLIRTLALINNRYNMLNIDQPDILEELRIIRERTSIAKVPLIQDAINQLSNPRTSHRVICRRIIELNSENPDKLVTKSFIKPIPDTEDEFISTLNAYFSFSLLDAFLYLSFVRKNKGHYLNKDAFAEALNDRYSKLSSIIFDPLQMYDVIDEDVGYHFLRECFLFIEQTRSLKYLLVHGYYQLDFIRQAVPHAFVEQLIDDYFYDITDLSQLRSDQMVQITVDTDRYDPNRCGMLENSTAVVHLLRRKQGVLTQSEQQDFVKLMSFTRDIGEVCNSGYLDVIADTSYTDDFKLVALCLMTINKKNQHTEFRLRDIIQEYCIRKFDSNILDLLRYLFQISPSVTEHLILTCNEKFLITLFHLVDKPVDALKLRAEMLQWYGEHTEEEAYLDRAKNLLIDIQIHKEKGTIDDSRIYVDPLRYAQWFEDNMLNKFTVALDSIGTYNNISLLRWDWNKKNQGVSGVDIVADLILSCYREFCENRSFGIASYLGRRIRHGTFEGTATTELHNLAAKPEYDELFANNEFKCAYEKWIAQYDKMIRDLKHEYLHIRNKRKPNGIITTLIDSVMKVQVADSLMYEVLLGSSKRTALVLLPSVVIDFCWRLVEYDLVETKKLLSEKKSNHGVFKFQHSNQDRAFRRHVSKFTQEVNSLTSQKFGLMASWFNKPNYAAPSTDIYLLFNAVVSEVKDSVNGFKPSIDLGEKSFTINGGVYYVIYDALYVLIHNAARHGKANGKITFDISKPANRNALKISLSTEVESPESLNYASVRIHKALSGADENAHVVEGNSGIKKLKNLELEGSISDVTYISRADELMICFEFYFELDQRGKYDDLDS